MTFLKRVTFIAANLFIALFAMQSRAQVVVNEKNLNDDKDLEYIQLMYFIQKSTLKPVFFVDYGVIEPEYNDILKPGRNSRPQVIRINGETVNDGVTVVGVLNRMKKAGWEYMGDVVYVPLPMLENWHIFTLKRK
jgi:hypothetical protein